MLMKPAKNQQRHEQHSAAKNRADNPGRRRYSAEIWSTMNAQQNKCLPL